MLKKFTFSMILVVSWLYVKNNSLHCFKLSFSSCLAAIHIGWQFILHFKLLLVFFLAYQLIKTFLKHVEIFRSLFHDSNRTFSAPVTLFIKNWKLLPSKANFFLFSLCSFPTQHASSGFCSVYFTTFKMKLSAYEQTKSTWSF